MELVPNEILWMSNAKQRVLIQVVAIEDLEPVIALPEMERYSQNDARWKHQVYAGSSTFGVYGCLICCVAMVVSAAYTDEWLPPDVARVLRNVGAFDGGYLNHPSRIQNGFDALVWEGALHWRYRAADLNFLAEEINGHGPVIMEVVSNPLDPTPPHKGNQHFVMAIEVTGEDVRIVDPWDGKDKLLSNSPYAKQAGWNAKRAIHGLRLLHPK